MDHPRVLPSVLGLLLAIITGACAGGGTGPSTESSGAAGTSGSKGVMGSVAGTQVTVPSGRAGIPPSGFESWPPTGYINVTPTEFGAYALGPAIDTTGSLPGAGGGSSTQPCSNILYGVVRDFRMAGQPGGHPDFEAYKGQGTKGAVLPSLGEDGKPQFAGICDSSQSVWPSATCPSGQQFTTKSSFDQWYRDSAGVNQSFVVAFQLVQNGTVYTFDSEAYFPLDGTGFGNQGIPHNYAFTTEVHSNFTYQGTETFTFNGDDDLWVYINGKLAMDLGGPHGKQEQSLALADLAASLELTPGRSYELALFNAERHTDASHFRIDTTLTFTNCGTLAKGIPIR